MVPFKDNYSIFCMWNSCILCHFSQSVSSKVAHNSYTNKLVFMKLMFKIINSMYHTKISYR